MSARTTPEPDPKVTAELISSIYSDIAEQATNFVALEVRVTAFIARPRGPSASMTSIPELPTTSIPHDLNAAINAYEDRILCIWERFELHFRPVNFDRYVHHTGGVHERLGQRWKEQYEQERKKLRQMISGVQELRIRARVSLYEVV